MVRAILIRHWLLAAIATAISAALLGVAVVELGWYDVGATNRHSNLTQWVTHEAMIHSVRRHARDVESPARFTAAQVVGGFCQYEAHCVACHGAAAAARAPWVSGLEPSPPYLLDAPQQFTSGQLLWIVRHGIKMTGMPAWRDSMSDAQIRDVVAWLEVSTKLPPQTYVQWRAQRRCGAATPPEFPAR